MRQGDTVKAFTLRRGAAEAMEVIVHGSENTSKIIGKSLIEVDWPNDITIGCIIRDNQVLFAHRDLVIEAEDHVILFLTDRSRIDEINALFSPEKRRSWLS
jgi:trk system potassium uptake protein TrkA